MRSLYISYNGITEPITQSQVLPYLNGLAENGIKFYLVTFEKGDVRKETLDELRRTILKNEFDIGEDLEWFALKYHKRPTGPATIFDVVIGFIASVYIIIRKRIDVVHARAIVAAAIGYPAARMLSKKFIFDTRGIDSEEYVDAGLWKRGGFKHRITSFLEDRFIRSSDSVIVLTNRFADVLKSKYADEKIKFTVIPCAVDTDRFKPKDKDMRLIDKLGVKDKYIIVYTGSLGTWYMLEEMLEFFKVAKEVIGNAHFLIYTQSDKAYVADVIRKSGVSLTDVSVDSIMHYSMPDRLAVCDVGIFFIKPVFSKLSSSPVKFAEYLSCGLPVIVNSGIGDTEGIIKKYNVGYVLEKFDKVNYREAIEYVTKMIDREKGGLKTRCHQAAGEGLSLKKANELYYGIYQNLSL